MFFKKNKKPKVKQHIIDNFKPVLNGDTKSGKLAFKFLFFILNKSLFGNKRREKMILDNDVTVFELIAFSYAKIYLKLEQYEKSKRILNTVELFKMNRLEYNDERTMDIMYLLKEIIKAIHAKHFQWDNFDEMFDNRVTYYIKNFEQSDRYCNSLRSLVDNSVNLSEPINDINNLNLHIGPITETMNFKIKIMAFENSILPLAYKEIKEFLDENIEFGFKSHSAFQTQKIK